MSVVLESKMLWFGTIFQNKKIDSALTALKCNDLTHYSDEIGCINKDILKTCRKKCGSCFSESKLKLQRKLNAISTNQNTKTPIGANAQHIDPTGFQYLAPSPITNPSISLQSVSPLTKVASAIPSHSPSTNLLQSPSTTQTDGKSSDFFIRSTLASDIHSLGPSLKYFSSSRSFYQSSSLCTDSPFRFITQETNGNRFARLCSTISFPNVLRLVFWWISHNERTKP